MKTKLSVIATVAFLVSACTTGTYMTRSYDDDIYFSPGDVPPVAVVQNEAPEIEKSAKISNTDAQDKKMVISQVDKNPDGTRAVNNYIYQQDKNNSNSDNQAYNMDNQDLVQSDTTVYYNDDDVKYVINNYYDDNNDIDFAYRIGRFHNPFYYSPFYDDWYYGYYSPWYSGYYGMNFGWGFDPWYGGWGYPYSYYGYYSPFAFGFGGYWGSGYGGYGGYYGDYYGGWGGRYGFGGSYYSDHQVARRRPTNMNLPGGGSNSNNVAIGKRNSNLTGGNTANQSVGQNNSATAPNTWVENGHTRSRSIDGSGNNQDTKNATIVNDRRSVNNTAGSQVQGNGQSRTLQLVRPGTTTSGNARRTYEPSTTGRTYNQGNVVRQSQNYTPSYNKPRIVNQSNYNNSYTRPRTAVGSDVKSATTGSTYSEPRSSSGLRQVYRSSSSYSIGSSSSPTRSTSNYSRSSSPSYSPPSSPSYSSPQQSSSGGGSFNSGSSGSGGSSGGSSGGGGGSGHRR